MSCFLICMVDILHLEVKSACSLYYSRCFMVFRCSFQPENPGGHQFSTRRRKHPSNPFSPFLKLSQCHHKNGKSEGNWEGLGTPMLRGIDSTAILCHEFPTKQRCLAIFRGCPTLLYNHQLSLVSNMSSYSQAFKQQVAVAKRKTQKQKVNSGELRWSHHYAMDIRHYLPTRGSFFERLAFE